MPTLNEVVKQIGVLVEEKDFQRDILFFKLIWGMVEVGEAIDLVKKYGLPMVTEDMDQKRKERIYDFASNLGEEIIDVVFYMGDAYRLLKRQYPSILSMDKMFDYKMAKNLNRPKKYGQQFINDFMRQVISHYRQEGILDELVTDFMNEAANPGEY